MLSISSATGGQNLLSLQYSYDAADNLTGISDKQGIDQKTTMRLDAALTLSSKLNQETPQRPVDAAGAPPSADI